MKAGGMQAREPCFLRAQATCMDPRREIVTPLVERFEALAVRLCRYHSEHPGPDRSRRVHALTAQAERLERKVSRMMIPTSRGTGLASMVLDIPSPMVLMSISNGEARENNAGR